MAKRAETTRKRDIILDDALEQSFPASDPPSQTNPSQGTKTNLESPDKGHKSKRNKMWKR